MAKTSKIVRTKRQHEIVQKYKAVRDELRTIIKNPLASEEDRDEAYSKLRKLPRDANPNRIRLRCELTGRPRAVYRKFKISRIMLRELAHKGEIPGMKKSSW